MTAAESLGLGSAVVFAASALIALRPLWFSGRRLSLEEGLAVGWVAWSILMAAFVIYVGLKLPMGFTRKADAPAVFVAVCISLITIFHLARFTTDWPSLVKKSIFGLFGLTLVVVSVTLGLTLYRN